MKRDTWLFAAGCAGGIVVVAVIWVAQSYFEAMAFNEITGRNVTTWQAMFVELRVNEAAMPKE